MFFNSTHFAIFFPVVFALVWFTRRQVARRNAILLVASYYFYGCWDWRFLSLIFISTIIDYTCGLLMDREAAAADPISATNAEVPPRNTRRRLLLLLSLVTNLGLLGFFKYFDFFISSAAELLQAVGMQANLPTLNIILPVGISFYTFQTLSYTIDLYFGRIRAERNLLNFALFVAFFPQLVAGPIERASRLLPQMSRPSDITWERMWTGFYLIGWGLFKKVVIADQIAKVADAGYGVADPTAAEVVMATYAFAIQIYCDFSGYSDIARGAARCLGFDLMLNFNLPYFASNPGEFWRRWHISLSTWLRDYLYIPLGGNRRGSRRTYVNLMATMVLGGLWHGAAWNFVLWGVYQGGLLCVHRLFQGRFRAMVGTLTGWLGELWFWVRVAVFFQLVCYGWLLFRANSMEQIISMTSSLSEVSGYLHTRHLVIDDLILLVACSLLFLSVQLIQWYRRDLEFTIRAPMLVRAFIYACGLLGFLFFGADGGQAFIYFQF